MHVDSWSRTSFHASDAEINYQTRCCPTFKHYNLHAIFITICMDLERCKLSQFCLVRFAAVKLYSSSQAFRVSMGKLGIITSVKFRIVREQPVMRTATQGLRPSEFLDLLRDAQQVFNRTGDLPTWTNESQVYWFVQDREVRQLF